ncbi:hypothetical protein N9B68_01575 [bacterium]|nr:hypothetical protein [bacterium]MDA7922972.1 hypothetical protein [bacterium]
MNNAPHKKLKPTLSWSYSWATLSLLLALPLTASAKQDHDETPLELSGYSLSESYQVDDDQPADLESPILKQLLYRVRQTSPKSRAQYSQFSQTTTWQEMASHTEDFRFWTFSRPARLTKIEKHAFKQSSSDDEIKGVYVCHCESIPHESIPPSTEDSATPPQKLIVLSRTIPKALPIDTEINQPIRISGFLYSRTLDAAGPRLVFITDRIEWYPQEKTNEISANQAELSKLGFDLGLIDLIRENNARSLNGRDAEAFFQMLAAMNRLDGMPADLFKESSSVLSFSDLFSSSTDHCGEAVRLQGVIRSCSTVSIPHQDIQDRLEISQYYQLMIFPDLGGAKIIIRGKDGSELDYQRFPITVCCTELPNGMSAQEVERKQCVIHGYFFRFWKYQSARTDLVDSTGQLSPLIIAKQPVLVETGIDVLDRGLLFFVLGTAALIIFLISYFRFVDRNQKPPLENMLENLPEKIDISGFDG